MACHSFRSAFDEALLARVQSSNVLAIVLNAIELLLIELLDKLVIVSMLH